MFHVELVIYKYGDNLQALAREDVGVDYDTIEEAKAVAEMLSGLDIAVSYAGDKPFAFISDGHNDPYRED